MKELEPAQKSTAHEYFSSTCFNAIWDILQKPDRTAQEDEQLLQLAFTSLWHWTQREDYHPRHLSIGYWMISRVYAVLEQGQNALCYAQKCLDASRHEEIALYFKGYAYEALTRAHYLLGDREEMQTNLHKANKVAEALQDEEERKLLLDDLATIK